MNGNLLFLVEPMALYVRVVVEKKPFFSNCLATTHPDISKQWHPTKNKLTPFDVVSKSAKKIWWKCNVVDDHEWLATVSSVVNGSGCSCCSNGRTVVLSNCLATTHPEITKQWHPTKNFPLTPFDVTFGNSKKVWWKCELADDHEWDATINNRTGGVGCPCCSGLKVVLSNCLATTHPEIAKQWHPIKNILTPFDVTFGSHKKVWWKCDVAPDHEWRAVVGTMVNSDGCLCCSGRKVVLSNCLLTTHPEIAKQWHPTKNFPLTPLGVTFGVAKKVWWKCDVSDDHEWEATINSRTCGNGCPCCGGLKVVLSNCLATIYPEISRQWHTTKNETLTPFDVVGKSSMKVWWKCDKANDHEWDASIASRTNGNGCPCCSGHKLVLSNCIATTHPELSKQWHPTKNFPLTPFDVTSGNGKIVWWKCDVGEDHEWQAIINSRTSMGVGCPCCSGKKAIPSNCLAITNPDLAKEWHPTKNLPLTPFDVVSGSEKNVWWKCDKVDDHEWSAIIYSRTNGNKCPCCSGQKVVLSNCLATTHPELIKQWHPTKNKYITPFDAGAGSDKKVWWKCDVGEDHEWQASINTRIQGSGCPCCTGQKTVLSNCLFTTHPDVAKQWHPTKNLPLTPFDVTFGSGKRVWWRCDKADNHEWDCLIYRRTRGGGCPFCFESNGEKIIKIILDDIKINYEIQKTFDECKHKRLLLYDFYLLKLNALIEYDGIQHFEPIQYFGGVNGFKLTQKRDEIKNEFAAKNNIPLLRIPYTKFDFIKEEIISFISTLTVDHDIITPK